MNRKKLKLTPAVIRRLEKKHGIKNLLGMSEEDSQKVNVDFLIDFTFEGLGHHADAPTRQEIEETFDLRDLLDNVKNYLGND